MCAMSMWTEMPPQGVPPYRRVRVGHLGRLQRVGQAALEVPQLRGEQQLRRRQVQRVRRAHAQGILPPHRRPAGRPGHDLPPVGDQERPQPGRPGDAEAVREAAGHQQGPRRRGGPDSYATARTPTGGHPPDVPSSRRTAEHTARPSTSEGMRTPRPPSTCSGPGVQAVRGLRHHRDPPGQARAPTCTASTTGGTARTRGQGRVRWAPSASPTRTTSTPTGSTKVVPLPQPDRAGTCRGAIPPPAAPRRGGHRPDEHSRAQPELLLQGTNGLQGPPTFPQDPVGRTAFDTLINDMYGAVPPEVAPTGSQRARSMVRATRGWDVGPRGRLPLRPQAGRPVGHHPEGDRQGVVPPRHRGGRQGQLPGHDAVQALRQPSGFRKSAGGAHRVGSTTGPRRRRPTPTTSAASTSTPARVASRVGEEHQDNPNARAYREGDSWHQN